MVRRLERNRPFLVPGEGMTGLLSVQSGLAGLFKQQLGAGIRIVGLAFPGEMVWRDVTVGVMTLQPSALDLVEDDTGGAYIHEAARRAFEWMSRDTRSSIERVAHLLCEVAHRRKVIDGPVAVPTQQQMGDITGQTAVNINRVLGDLERQGLIERATGCHGLIKIADHDALARVGSFSPEYLQ
jgi:hypothetical protein